MATDFRSATTGQLAFVRFYGGYTRGTCYEFGTVTNFERVRLALDNGELFVALDEEVSELTTVVELDDLAYRGLVTFGEMGMTLEVGSGEVYDMTVEE